MSHIIELSPTYLILRPAGSEPSLIFHQRTIRGHHLLSSILLTVNIKLGQAFYHVDRKRPRHFCWFCWSFVPLFPNSDDALNAMISLMMIALATPLLSSSSPLSLSPPPPTLLYRYQWSVVLASSSLWRLAAESCGGKNRRKAGSGISCSRSGKKGGSFLTLRGMLSGSRCRNMQISSV